MLFYSSCSLHTLHTLCCVVPGTQHTPWCHTINTSFCQGSSNSPFVIVDPLTWKKWREEGPGYRSCGSWWNWEKVLCIMHTATVRMGRGLAQGNVVMTGGPGLFCCQGSQTEHCAGLDPVCHARFLLESLCLLLGKHLVSCLLNRGKVEFSSQKCGEAGDHESYEDSNA